MKRAAIEGIVIGMGICLTFAGLGAVVVGFIQVFYAIAVCNPFPN